MNKTNFAKKLVLAGLFGVSGAAMALPTLPVGPAYLTYTGVEQVNTSDSLAVPGGGTEGNWGIIRIGSISGGTANPDNQLVNQGTATWNAGQGGQIIGIFSGIDLTTGTTATGGTLSLYWLAGSTLSLTQIEATGPGARTAAGTVTGINDAGTTHQLLATMTFSAGSSSVLGDTTTTVQSTSTPTSLQTGQSSSYLNVVPNVGLWAADLNTDWFQFNTTGDPLSLYSGTTDVYSQNAYASLDNRTCTARNPSTHVCTAYSYTYSNWTDTAANTYGFQINSGTVMADVAPVPEPASMALISAALIGFGVSRRKQK